jgi:hypothetical protein
MFSLRYASNFRMLLHDSWALRVIKLWDVSWCSNIICSLRCEERLFCLRSDGKHGCPILVQGLHRSDTRDNRHDGLPRISISSSHRHTTYIHTYIFGVNGRVEEKRGWQQQWVRLSQIWYATLGYTTDKDRLQQYHFQVDISHGYSWRYNRFSVISTINNPVLVTYHRKILLLFDNIWENNLFLMKSGFANNK